MLSALCAIDILSVCPSVTRVDQSNTGEVRIKQFSSHNSPILLVFAALVSSRNCNRYSLNGGAKQGWGGENKLF